MSAPRCAERLPRPRVAVISTALLVVAGALAVGTPVASALTVRKKILESAPFTEPNMFKHPTGVAVDQATGNVYVADSAANVIDVFGAEGGAPADGVPTKIKGLDFGEGEPEAVAVDNSCLDQKLTGSTCEAADPANGDVYAAESVGHAIVRFKLNTTTHEYEQETFQEIASGFEPNGVAVDTHGDVYVANYDEQAIKLFAPNGEPLGAVAQSLVAKPAYVAVATPGAIYVGNYEGGVAKIEVNSKYEATGEEFLPVPTGAIAGGAVAVEANGDTYVDEGARTEAEGSLIAVYDTAGALTEIFGANEFPESQGLAIDGETGDVYIANPTEGDLGAFGPPIVASAPAVTIQPATGISDHCATFHGEVNPEGFATTYTFEDSTDGVTWSPVAHGSAGSGSSEVPVSQHVCGLAGSSNYDVRLSAENAGGSHASSAEAFSTPASAPQLSGAGATVLDGSEVTLYATIHPEGQAATYHFEYGSTSTYGESVPLPDGQAGSATAQISQTITGLSGGTTYYFRLAATNGTGTTYGGTGTFTTSLVSAVGEPVSGLCPNEALRAESNVDATGGVPYSTQLPDCRAYEQVTPTFKSFNHVVTGGPGLATAATVGISSMGSPLVEKSTPLLGSAGADEELVGTFYELLRGAGGWTTSSLTPLASVFPVSQQELASPSDAAVGLWAAGTATQSIDDEDFYRREADGEFVNVGPIAPPSATAGPSRGPQPHTDGTLNSTVEDRIVGASADLAEVIFQLDSPQESSLPSILWPGDGTVYGGRGRPSLYEYVGTGHSGEGADVPELVGVDNAGVQISQCGTGLGANTGFEPLSVHNGISSAGSTVFYNAQAGGCISGATGPSANQVYARIGVPGAAQATVNVAAASQSECEAAPSCGVTSPVAFQGASKDGSKVFFTTSQALLPGDKDATGDLYECELPGDDGATPTPEGDVNACPDLKAISVTGTSSGANVQSVLAVSEEGSRVYFTATGVLTGEPDHSLPTGRQLAEEGKDNLYVWEALGKGQPAGHTSFIATLPTASPGEAQATPNGRYLVFTTTGQLTGDDTSTAAQAFRYDAQTGELLRISIGQSGFNEDGNTSTDPVTLALRSLERLTISENGSYVVFQSSDALTPQVHGGTNNVYEWQDGNVYLISDGTDSQSNAGLIGMDATGENIFFVTADKLVGQDTDEDYDVYDARVDGGFPAPTPEPSCSGEACQGPLTGSLGSTTPLITSNGAPSIGNLPAATAKHTGAGARQIAITGHVIKGSAITLFVSAAGSGLISVSGAGVKELRKSVPRAGVYSVRPALTGRERRLLRRRRRLRLELTVSFRSASGTTSSAKVAVTVWA
jgi:hypothetical protein